MATNRRVYPSINALRSFVQTELSKRKKGSKAVPTPTITPFVRMTSAMEDSEQHYRFFSLGLHGITDRELEGNLFDLTYGNRDVVGFGYDTPGSVTTDVTVPLVPGAASSAAIPLSVTSQNDVEEGTRFRRRPIQSTQSPDTAGELPAGGKHPIPGITDVSVNYKGINDVVNVEVTWKCYNSTQLNFLRNHFLVAGQYVVVDFGHIISSRVNSEPIRPFDFANGDAITKLARYEHGGRLAVVDGEGGLDPLVEDNNGNYEIFIGKIIDSSLSLQTDNTYECKTVIVSTGEVIYGVTQHSLIADLSKNLTEEEGNEYIATLEEFFSEGGELDAVVGRAAATNDDGGEKDVANQPSIVDAYRRLRTRSGTRVEGMTTSGIAGGSKITADQFVYVSWNFFTHEIIPQMFSVLGDQPVNAEINFFLDIGKPVIDVAIAADPRKKSGESEIGNHPLLTSVDHKTLIVIKNYELEDDVARNGAPALFAGSKTFSDENGDDKKGYLSRGVYVNVDAIKESFLQTRTFYEGVAALLRRMNNATANYWKLDIGFDEESKKMYIFDRGNIIPDFPTIPTAYLFNKGTEGELLGLDFNASYTDEVKTSIMISGRTRGRGSYGGVTIGARDYSVTFGPDRHGLILNTNSFEDVLQRAVNAISATKRREQLALLGKTPESERARAVQAREEVVHAALVEDRDEEDPELTELEKQLKKYTNELESYLQLPSSMKGHIASHGLTHSNTPNNYLAPLATEITCQLTMMGISGIAFWDCFQVDKLPKVYGEHGVFLVNGISHHIGQDGWTTDVMGLYYFIWKDGQQGARVQEASEPHDELFVPPTLVVEDREKAEEERREREQYRQSGIPRIVR